ncbi:hypothetical protein [Streptococcus jiangjianxini]|uniref:hypothetical protein n=1 Tax=Streptococcus jiangjianxini TaxID=3161189 RepID=UPI0032F02909
MVKKMTIVSIIFMSVATIAHLMMSIIAFQNGASLNKNILNGILMIVFVSIIKTLLELRKTK